jgi:predicted nucleic acid-binding protein
MLILADTNVLIRMEIAGHPDHVEAASAVRILRAAGHTFGMAAQGASEFWNVCTRPATARGGLGLTVAVTDLHLAHLESYVAVQFDSSTSYGIWRRLVVTRGVSGVQVHDARIAALMLANGITHILTYNGKDFTRFPGISAVSPADVVAGNVPPP